MKISSSRVVLENNTDLINYVTKGLSPSKKDFQQLKEDMQNGKLLDPDRNIINTNITPEDLQLIYNNKMQNELVALIVGGVLVVVAFTLGMRRGSSQTRRECNDKFFDYLDDMDTSASLERWITEHNNGSSDIKVTHL